MTDFLAFLEQFPAFLAVFIFLARIGDVSLGTLRTILLFRGHKVYAAGLGFIEVLLWLAAAGLVFQNLGEWYLAIAYAGGFATGNYIGVWLESKLALGVELVRAISENRRIDLAGCLRERGYSVIEVTGSGAHALPVEVLLVVERRREVPRLLRAIFEVDPEAKCTTSDVRSHPFRRVLQDLPAASTGKRK